MQVGTSARLTNLNAILPWSWTVCSPHAGHIGILWQMHAATRFANFMCGSWAACGAHAGNGASFCSFNCPSWHVTKISKIRPWTIQTSYIRNFCSLWKVSTASRLPNLKTIFRKPRAAVAIHAGKGCILMQVGTAARLTNLNAILPWSWTVCSPHAGHIGILWQMHAATRFANFMCGSWAACGAHAGNGASFCSFNCPSWHVTKISKIRPWTIQTSYIRNFCSLWKVSTASRLPNLKTIFRKPRAAVAIHAGKGCILMQVGTAARLTNLNAILPWSWTVCSPHAGHIGILWQMHAATRFANFMCGSWAACGAHAGNGASFCSFNCPSWHITKISKIRPWTIQTSYIRNFCSLWKVSTASRLPNLKTIFRKPRAAVAMDAGKGCILMQVGTAARLTNLNAILPWSWTVCSPHAGHIGILWQMHTATRFANFMCGSWAACGAHAGNGASFCSFNCSSWHVTKISKMRPWTIQASYIRNFCSLWKVITASRLLARAAISNIHARKFQSHI